MPSSTKVLTVNELAEYLRVHRSTIYRLLKKGQLPGFKIGSDWRFNVEVIDEWRLRQGPGVLEEEVVEERTDVSKRYGQLPSLSKLPDSRLPRSAAEVTSVCNIHLIFRIQADAEFKQVVACTGAR